MEWNFHKIECFLRASQETSLSEAARKMFFMPQALNKSLRELENDLGVKLINRSRGPMGTEGGMSLTSAGEQMREYFMPCYQEYLEAVNKMEKYLEHRKKMLRIGYFRGIRKDETLMPIYQKLSENKDIESIELLSGELGEIYDWVQDEICDVGITNIHTAERRRKVFRYVPIRRMPARILISSKHPWAYKDRITVEDMAQETMVVLRWDAELEKDNFWKIAEVKKRKVVNSIDAMYMQVKIGNCFCVTSDHFEGDYDTNLVKRDLPEEYSFYFVLCMIYRERNCFWEILEQIAEKYEITEL